MSRPEDIPRQVWDYAENYTHERDVAGWTSREMVARAIMAAKAEERQQCINVVLSFIQYGGDTHHGITVNPLADAAEIARALHKRGEA